MGAPVRTSRTVFASGAQLAAFVNMKRPSRLDAVVGLVNAGVPRDRIVLAFKHPDLRKYTDFAAA